ncbi:uncharacterized protein LOC143232543 [Tachypleus tridentatus]|uniref:uncharacterized protein LOC143232543 n=1 Tax=Tachypleus tridentatus TaxID=6853 RepID=UPI003FD0705E
MDDTPRRRTRAKFLKAKKPVQKRETKVVEIPREPEVTVSVEESDAVEVEIELPLEDVMDTGEESIREEVVRIETGSLNISPSRSQHDEVYPSHPIFSPARESTGEFPTSSSLYRKTADLNISVKEKVAFEEDVRTKKEESCQVGIKDKGDLVSQEQLQEEHDLSENKCMDGHFNIEKEYEMQGNGKLLERNKELENYSVKEKVQEFLDVKHEEKVLKVVSDSVVEVQENLKKGTVAEEVQDKTFMEKSWSKSFVEKLQSVTDVKEMQDQTILKNLQSEDLVHEVCSNEDGQSEIPENDIRFKLIMEAVQSEAVVEDVQIEMEDMQSEVVVQDVQEEIVVQDVQGEVVVQDVQGEKWLYRAMQESKSVVEDVRGESVVEDVQDESVVEGVRDEAVAGGVEITNTGHIVAGGECFAPDVVFGDKVKCDVSLHVIEDIGTTAEVGEMTEDVHVDSGKEKESTKQSEKPAGVWDDIEKLAEVACSEFLDKSSKKERVNHENNETQSTSSKTASTDLDTAQIGEQKCNIEQSDVVTEHITSSFEKSISKSLNVNDVRISKQKENSESTESSKQQNSSDYSISTKNNKESLDRSQPVPSDSPDLMSSEEIKSKKVELAEQIDSERTEVEKSEKVKEYSAVEKLENFVRGAPTTDRGTVGRTRKKNNSAFVDYHGKAGTSYLCVEYLVGHASIQPISATLRTLNFCLSFLLDEKYTVFETSTEELF